MAQTAEVRVVVPRPTIAIGYNEHRPWRQKWQDMLHALEELDSAYATEEGQGNEDVRRMVEDFFEICRELADWLWQDKQNANVSESAVTGFVRNDPHLRLADGMAQTTKHHTRKGNDPITARIPRSASDPKVRALRSVGLGSVATVVLRMRSTWHIGAYALGGASCRRTD